MNIQGFAGLFVFTAMAWMLSEHRTKVHPKMMITGIMLQFIIALILLKITFFRDCFESLNQIVLCLVQSTEKGTAFVFGYIGGGDLPFTVSNPTATYILGFRGLVLVLVMSALSSLLFYWRILPLIVKGFSWCLRKTMRIGGAEGLGVSANVFIGMVEAPLLIRPYLKDMTRSELFTIMTCGMATIAGTVMVLYASILQPVIPGIMGHILTASIISVPAAVMVSKIMIPETSEPTSGELVAPEEASSSMDAITRGTISGVQLLINIIAMLIVLVSLVHLINIVLGFLPHVSDSPITLERMLGWIIAPIVWLMGIPWEEAPVAGSLMGIKTVLNEFLAYDALSKLPEGTLNPRSLLIITYAMCGFANPGSLGIMIGGLGTMAPERRDEIVGLGFRSIVAGTFATCMTGAVVGIIG